MSDRVRHIELLCNELSISYTVRRLTRFFEHHPRALLWLLKVKSGDNRDQVVKKTTTVLLEGFGGSANSYLYAVFKFANGANKTFKLAGHTHHSAQVIQAVQWKIPVVVILRNPVDSIVSLCARESMSTYLAPMGNKRLERHVQYLLQEYVYFYESISHLGGDVVFVDFELVINDVNRVIARVNDRFNIDLKYYVDDDLNNQMCFGNWSPVTKQVDSALKERVMDITKRSQRTRAVSDEAEAVYRRYVANYSS